MRDKENFRATLYLCPQYIRLSLYEAVANFVLFGEEPQFKGSEHSSLWQLWEQIKPQIGGSVCNCNEKEEKERTKEKEEVLEGKEGIKEEREVLSYDNPSLKKKSNPTLSEVKAYFCELNSSEDEAIRFYEYYDGRGWLCKGEPIANWKALAQYWKPHEIKNNSGMQVMKTPEQIIEEYNKMYPPEPT